MSDILVDPGKLANLAVAVWRTHRRASKADAASEPVLLALESALDRLGDLGVRVDDMVGRPYHDNLRVNVVERVDGEEARVLECLSPAVYFGSDLLRPADVVVSDRTPEGKE